MTEATTETTTGDFSPETAENLSSKSYQTAYLTEDRSTLPPDPATAHPPRRTRRLRRTSWAVAACVAALALTPPAFADETAADEAAADDPAVADAGVSSKDVEADPATLPSFYARTTVTATGSEADTFEIATPVTVITAEEIREKAPNNAADLLREQPGVDVNGVGVNQVRPIIRGQRGLRVLFLADGLRMNNARRQSDFGEITSLVNLESVDRVEVVRGPASVLYGSDALGGVLNLVTHEPPSAGGFGGVLDLRGGSVDDQVKAHAAVHGATDRLSFHLGYTYRDAENYEAPGGTFGDVTLADDVEVVDTGLKDDAAYSFLSYQLTDKHQLSLRYNRYRAEETGFGFVEPADLGETDPFRIRIYYPFQDFDRWQLGYLGSALGSPLADTVDLKVYYQNNERRLINDIDNINIGPIFPGAPDSMLETDTDNFTELETFGTRLETIKLAGDRHLLTYGFEAFEDDSFNTDVATTRIFLRFPFPPFEIVDTTVNDVANAPNATNSSYGVFVQDEIVAGDRLKLTLGARYQRVETEAEPTPDLDTAGLDFEDDAVVGSINVLYGLTEYLNLVASYGTAFRAPNIIERLFLGPTPEGSGYQILNSDLASEESDNVDFGVKYRRRNAYFEAFYFRTEIDEGIIQYFLSDAEVAALPQEVQDDIAANGASFVVQQRNADRLRYEGIELSFGWRAESGFSIGANYTHLDAQRIDSSQPPTGDTFSDKYNLSVRWQPPQGRYWVEYRVRRNSDADVSISANEPPPLVGRVLPGFTVQTLGGGLTLFARGDQEHELGLVVDNLTDELYAEFSNATFFRPQPGRNAILTYRVRF